MEDFVKTTLKKYLDEGKTLIECRKLGLDISELPDKNFDYFCLSTQRFPDNYFEEEKNGVTFVTPDKIKNSRLPHLGIILTDGTIFRVDTFHAEVALWLKFNKRNPQDEEYIDLRGSLRYVHFPHSKKLSVVQGYDYSKKFEQTNLYDLIHAWTTYYDCTKHDTDILLTENQVITLFRLCKVYDVDFEDMLNSNVGFCMESVNPEQRKKANKNNSLINATLSRIRDF